MNEVFEQADLVVLAVPSAYIKTTLQPLRVSLENKFIVSAIKGIIANEYITIAEFMNQDYGVPFDRIGIVSGPSHAEEVAMERLTYLTMVCKDIDNAKVLGRKFASRYINTVYSTDIYGVEYGAVLKNIYAVAVGICTGLGYGDNFMAVLIANSAMEMSRFMERTYPSPRDFNASVYLGDLLVTCYSKFSRNRTFGTMIGKGYSVKSTMIEMTMVAEGYYSSACINQINKKFDIYMPIADAVYRILYQKGVCCRHDKETAKRSSCNCPAPRLPKRTHAPGNAGTRYPERRSSFPIDCGSGKYPQREASVSKYGTDRYMQERRTQRDSLVWLRRHAAETGT